MRPHLIFGAMSLKGHTRPLVPIAEAMIELGLHVTFVVMKPVLGGWRDRALHVSEYRHDSIRLIQYYLISVEKPSQGWTSFRGTSAVSSLVRCTVIIGFCIKPWRKYIIAVQIDQWLSLLNTDTSVPTSSNTAHHYQQA